MGRWVMRRTDGRAKAWRLCLFAGVTVVAGMLLLAFWARPPGGLVSAHQHIISILRWIRIHWLNAVAATAFITAWPVAQAAVALVARRTRSADDPGTDRLSRERAVMLHQVRYKWITGVLEPSLADAARISLGLKTYPGVLDLGTRVLRRAGQLPTGFPEGTTIGAIFDQVGSGLLILGRPGAGKTTLLLQLADELITRAEGNLEEPIPVVFHLSSWASEPKPLEEWLAGELAATYDVPAGTAAAWLEHGALTLLLDGLDEVGAAHRAACVQAINDYRHDHGLVPVAVCSRTAEMEEMAVKLHLHEAVELQPPSDSEIDQYLGYLEATGTPVGDVRAAFMTDESLGELLRSPLMLHVVALAYHGRPAPALEAPGSSTARREQLWGAYIVRMFEQRPLKDDCRYTPSDAIRWLRWLALGLSYHDEAEFHLFEIGVDWFPSNMKQARQVPSNGHGGNGTGTTDPAEGPKAPRVVGGPYIWPVTWLFASARVSVRYVVLLWIVGAATATALHHGPLTELIVSLVCGIGTIGSAGILQALYGRMSARHFSGTPTSPSERIWRPVKDASIGGSVAALLLGTLYGSVLGIVYKPSIGLITALITAAVAGSIAWIGIGGGIFLFHFAARAELARTATAPWRLPSFLEEMTERQLLRRSGGAYLFVHRMLRDFFATPDPGFQLDLEAGLFRQPSIGGTPHQ